LGDFMAKSNIEILRSLQLCIKLLSESLKNPKEYNIREPLETRLRFILMKLEKIYDQVSYADE
jgi:hypothetical protein